MIVEMIRDNKGRFLKPMYPKLKISPCIFCGAEAILEMNTPTQQAGTCEGLYPRAFWVECSECGARGPNLDKESALSEWELIASRSK